MKYSMLTPPHPYTLFSRHTKKNSDDTSEVLGGQVANWESEARGGGGACWAFEGQGWSGVCVWCGEYFGLVVVVVEEGEGLRKRGERERERSERN